MNLQKIKMGYLQTNYYVAPFFSYTTSIPKLAIKMNNKTSENHQFEIIVPLGLEQLALEEIELKRYLFALPKIDLFLEKPGSIKCITTFNNIIDYIQYLKIPSRVLLNIHQFKSRDFPSFFKKVKKISWNKYLSDNDVKINVKSSSSRLIHTKKIEDCFKDAISNYFKANEAKKAFKELQRDFKAHLYLHLLDDQVMIFLNLTGDALTKRKEIRFNHPAPLKENIASAAYFFLYQTMKEEKMNLTTLVDPFCGTGTLLFEGNNFFSKNKTIKLDYKFLPITHQIIENDYSINGDHQRFNLFIGKGSKSKLY